VSGTRPCCGGRSAIAAAATLLAAAVTVVAPAAAAPTAAAGTAGGAAGLAPSITVLAATSLTNVLPRITRAGVRYSFGGSDLLGAQIEQGAPADVFAAASPKAPEALHAQGLVEQPIVFATNSLVLVVPAANPAGLKSVYDVRRPGIKLLVGNAGVPIGAYTRQLLKSLGLGAALANAVSQETDPRSILGKVALGEADAGFVYATDARTAAGRVRVIPLPERAQPPVRYVLAIVKSTRNRVAAVAFVNRVLGQAGQAALRRDGFGSPRPAPQAIS
jgi:molybdate transport system substrate-binding protein